MADITLERMMRIYGACEELSTEQRLEVLTFVWLAVASNARTEALVVPGGFPAERDRQVKTLRTVAECVGADEPDLEVQRLCQEGDHEGWMRVVLQRFTCGPDATNE